MNIIEKYFPHLTDEQKKQFAALDGLYRDWNAKINVISRKDIDNLYEHHVLHSLAIAKAINFRPGSEILDFGCGGGFPGIPLAILFPECKFKLIDGTGADRRPPADDDGNEQDDGDRERIHPRSGRLGPLGRGRQIDGDQTRHAALLHRHADQLLAHLHGDLAVRDEHELGLR